MKKAYLNSLKRRQQMKYGMSSFIKAPDFALINLYLGNLWKTHIAAEYRRWKKILLFSFVYHLFTIGLKCSWEPAELHTLSGKSCVNALNNLWLDTG